MRSQQARVRGCCAPPPTPHNTRCCLRAHPQNFLDANTAANDANTSWLVHGSTVDTAEFEETFLAPAGTACAGGWGPNYPPANFQRCLDPEQ